MILVKNTTGHIACCLHPRPPKFPMAHQRKSEILERLTGQLDARACSSHISNLFHVPCILVTPNYQSRPQTFPTVHASFIAQAFPLSEGPPSYLPEQFSLPFKATSSQKPSLGLAKQKCWLHPRFFQDTPGLHEPLTPPMAASGQRAAYVAPSPQDKLLNPGSYSINIHGEKGRASKKRKYVRYYSSIME